MINDIDKLARTFLLFVKQIGFTKIHGMPYNNWAKCLFDNEIKKRLLLKPRGTYKTSFYTVAYAIFKLLLNPNLRILIAMDGEDNSKLTLHQIKKIIERFTLFDRGEIWTATQIEILNEDKITKEPSISVCGVRQNIVSRHYDLAICDDLVNLKDRHSLPIREHTKRWYSDLTNLLDPGCEVLVVGTRWHQDDLYNSIINEINPRLPESRKYFVEIETPYDDLGNLMFAHITEELLLEKKAELKSASLFSCLYMNEPLPESEQLIAESQLGFFEYKNNQIVLLEGGCSTEKSEKTVINMDSLVLYTFLEPATGKSKRSDYAVIITVATDGNHIFVVDVVVTKIKPLQFIETMLSLHKIYHYRLMGIETNAFQQIISDILHEKSKEQGLHLPIVEVVQSTQKKIRIQGLQPYLATHKVLFRSDYKDFEDYKELINQIIYYPIHRYDDAPDCLKSVINLIPLNLVNFKGFTHG